MLFFTWIFHKSWWWQQFLGYFFRWFHSIYGILRCKWTNNLKRNRKRRKWKKQPRHTLFCVIEWTFSCKEIDSIFRWRVNIRNKNEASISIFHSVMTSTFTLCGCVSNFSIRRKNGQIKGKYAKFSFWPLSHKVEYFPFCRCTVLYICVYIICF